MAEVLVTRQGLKNDLADFRTRGDSRWAKASDIDDLVSDALEDAEVLRREDVSGLTDFELETLLGRI